MVKRYTHAGSGMFCDGSARYRDEHPDDLYVLAADYDELRGAKGFLREKIAHLESMLDGSSLLSPLRPLLAVVEAVRSTVTSRQCSDGDCMWGPPEGMHTNGGCQHRKMNTMEARREIAAIAGELVRALDAYYASKEGENE